MGVCVAGAGAVLGAGWAIQAATLPPPQPATRVAANAAVSFEEHHFAVDVFHVDGRRLVAACLEGWFRAHPGAAAIRGSLVSFRHGPLLLVSMSRRVTVLRGPALPFLPGALAVAAGCPRVLAHTFGRAAEFSDRLTVERSRAASQPALALHLRRGRRERLTLYVSPRGDHPLVAIVALGGREATARIFLGHASAAALARFHMGAALHRGKGGA